MPQRLALPILIGLLCHAHALSATAVEEPATLKLARSLMPKGYDLARVQELLLGGQAVRADALAEVVASSLIIHDLNGDGLKDVFMVIEPNPAFPKAGSRDCEITHALDGREVCWGNRVIEVYYQQNDGSYRLGTRSTSLMMNRGEGGMNPDPFTGMWLTPKGSIQLRFEGGAGWKWEYVYTLKYWQDDIHVIGRTTYECNGVRDDVECFRHDINLRTGQWWRESWMAPAGRVKKQKGVDKNVRPIRLQDAQAGS